MWRIFALLLVSWLLRTEADESQKRLLVNDPDVIARLSNLESTIQGLLVMMTSLNSTVQDKISKQEGIIRVLEHNLTTLQVHNSIQQTTISQLSLISQDHRTSYVRWGSSQCSGTDAQLVYAGYASGQKYYNGNDYYRGGPSNMLCLPNNPELDNVTAGGNSFLYGSEYDDSKFGSNSFDQDVPCALCLSHNSSTTVMIPGRKTCYAGWKLEYNGVLASGASNHAASSYICVDMHPEYIPGGRQDNNDHTLFTTGYKCGSLPCPPYNDDVQAYCVVCSK